MTSFLHQTWTSSLSISLVCSIGGGGKLQLTMTYNSIDRSTKNQCVSLLIHCHSTTIIVQRCEYEYVHIPRNIFVVSFDEAQVCQAKQQTGKESNTETGNKLVASPSYSSTCEDERTAIIAEEGEMTKWNWNDHNRKWRERERERDEKKEERRKRKWNGYVRFENLIIISSLPTHSLSLFLLSVRLWSFFAWWWFLDSNSKRLLRNSRLQWGRREMTNCKKMTTTTTY